MDALDFCTSRRFSANKHCRSLFVHTHFGERNQHRKEDTMTAQENVAQAQSLVDLYNHHQSDPAWLDKSLAAFAADSTFIDIPSAPPLPRPPPPHPPPPPPPPPLPPRPVP